MSNHTLTVVVPDRVFEHIRQIATETEQSMAAVAAQQLESSLDNPELVNLPQDEQRELAVFHLLSIETLQGIMREQLPTTVQDYMQTLMDQNTAGTISPSAHSELATLVERSNRLTLRKAWAADILMKRGLPVTRADFAA